MKKLVAVLLCASLSGCGLMAMNRFEAWQADARPRAESGQLPWSEYYTQGYQEVLLLPDSLNGKGFAMLQMATLIDAARAMEAGQMGQQEFFSLQRRARAELQMHMQQNAMQQQALFNQWLQTQAVIQQQYRPPAAVNCTTSKVGNFYNTNCR